MSFVRGTTWANRIAGGGSSLTGVTEDGGTPNVVTVADSLVIDGGGGATGGLTINDSGSNADVSLTEVSGRATLSGATGVGLSNGTQFLYWIGNDLYPQNTGSANLGTTTEAFNALTLGDGTAQVTLGHNGTNDGRLVVSDPNSVAGGRIDLLDAAGNADVNLFEDSGIAYLNGDQGVRLQVGGNHEMTLTGSFFGPAASKDISLGSSSQRFASGHFDEAGITIYDSSGNADVYLFENAGIAYLNGDQGVRLQVGWNHKMTLTGSFFGPAASNDISLGSSFQRFASGHFDATGITIYDSGGNADVTLSENGSGVAVLNGAAGVRAAVNGTDYYQFDATKIVPLAAGVRTLGSAALEWGNVYTSGSIYLGSGQEAELKQSSNALRITGTNDNEYVDICGVSNAYANFYKNAANQITIDADDPSVKVGANGYFGFVNGDSDAAPDTYLSRYAAAVTHLNGSLAGTERSSNPPAPAEGEFVIWMSDGTGVGNDGDFMIATTAGGTTKYAALFVHSGGTNYP